MVGSFIEVKNLLPNECDQPLRISENQLKLWGADIRLLSPKENNQEGIKLNNRDSFKRDEQYPLCMTSSNFLCAECSQFFYSTSELENHIKTHQKRKSFHAGLAMFISICMKTN